MAIRSIHLRKLLQLIGADQAFRISLLRSDIREQIKKDSGVTSGGGDFYTPFWADVKAHVAGGVDIHKATQERIERNHRRKRLYPQLLHGFSSLWSEKRRWLNEPIQMSDKNVHGVLEVTELRATIKVHDILLASVGGDRHRLVYPYFAEKPPLTNDMARLGLWVMNEALIGERYIIDEMRIIDVLRGSSFSVQRGDLTGREGADLRSIYSEIIDHWERLRLEY